MKRFLPESLLGRAVLTVVVPILLLEAMVTYAFFDRHWDEVTKTLVRGVAADVALIREGLEEARTPEETTAILGAAERNTGLVIRIEPEIAVPPTSQPSRLQVFDRILWRQLNRNLPGPVWFNPDYGDDTIEIRTEFGDGSLAVLVPQTRLTTSTADIFILWMVGSSIVLTVIAVLFLRDQVHPIRKLAEAAENFGKGRSIPDFAPTGTAEVRRAAQEFLRMKERIERQISQRTEMLAGVSHDLRTPLTRLKLQLAMLGDSNEVEGLQQDVEDMTRMVEEFLDFSRGEAGEPSRITDLRPLLTRLVESEKCSDYEISLDAEGDLRIPLRENSLKRCVANLIDNSADHASVIHVSATRNSDSVEIIVDDDGPGIPDPQKGEAFRPFTRFDKARNSKKGGVGLGLAIARDSARSHGGDIHLEDSPLGGLRAVVRLPA